MKFERINDLIIVYIFDKKYKNKNYDEIIKLIFNILENYYNYKIKESYTIKIYINKYYGMICEIYGYDEYLYNTVNIDLKLLKDTLFLYEVDDPLDYIDNEIYYYNDKYYINIKKENINLIESSNIIYGKEVYKIIGKGIKL